MTFPGFGMEVDGVALRKESVDRNMGSLPLSTMTALSLSVRRAWIEIKSWGNSETQADRRSP